MTSMIGASAFGGQSIFRPSELPLPSVSCGGDSIYWKNVRQLQERAKQEGRRLRVKDGTESECFTRQSIGYPKVRPEKVFRDLFSQLPESRNTSRWASKIKLMQIASSNPHIRTLSFAPTDHKEQQTWFIHTQPTLKNISRFFIAPHPEYRGMGDAPHPALSLTRAITFSIPATNEEIARACSEIPTSSIDSIRQILTQFLDDPESKALAITFDGEENEIRSEIWIKRFAQLI